MGKFKKKKRDFQHMKKSMQEGPYMGKEAGVLEELKGELCMLGRKDQRKWNF
jgi:hypothetical protein